MIDLQTLLDDLCERLNRTTAIDNEYYEFVAVSGQVGASDRVREESVLNRHNSPEIITFLDGLQLASATEPVQVPISEVLESLPRWAFPIRSSAKLFGFLWIIDSPPLSDDEVALASSYVESMREAFTSNLEHAHSILRSSIHLTRSLIYEGHVDALTQADRSGLLYSLGPVEIWNFILQTDDTAGRLPSSADLTDLLADLHLTTRPGSLIGMPYENRLTIVTRTQQVQHAHLALHRSVGRSCQRQGLRIVASGSAAMGPNEDPAVAHERAVFAASVARWESRDEPLDWRELGAWTLLFRTPLNSEQVKMLSPGAYELIHHGQSSHWQTLLTYLDHGCDVVETCAALHIQRATLYYRLKRVREIAGEQIISDGWERSSAHLALRLWRACLNGASDTVAREHSALSAGR